MKKRLLALVLATAMVMSNPIVVNAEETTEISEEISAETVPEGEEKTEEEEIVEEGEKSVEISQPELPEEEKEEIPEEVVEVVLSEEIEVLAEEAITEELIIDNKLLKAVKEDEEVAVEVSATTDGDTDYVYFDEEPEFATWQKAVSFINSQNKKYVYTIALHKDININGNLPLPSKAKRVIIESNGHSLNVGGTITLNTDLSIPYSINTTKASTTINLNNHHLDMAMDDLTMFNIKGTEANSALYLDNNSQFSLGKINVTKLGTYGTDIIFTFNDNATIGNFVFEEFDETKSYDFKIKDGAKVNITKGIKFNGFQPEAKCIRVSKKDKNSVFQPLNDGDLLFTIAGSLNANIFEIKQTDNPADIENLIVYREGNNFYAGKERFAVTDIETGASLGSCSTWNSVISTINNQAAANGRYQVSTSEDITFAGGITFPSAKKCQELVIDGNSVAVLNYKNDLTAVGNVTFRNITLNSTKKNPKLNLGDKRVEFDNVEFKQEFASVSGTKTGHLVVNNKDVVSLGGISVPNLTVSKAAVSSINGGINVSADTTLTSATIEVKTSAIFKNIESKNDQNKIVYGQTAKDKLSITGKVNVNTSSVSVDGCVFDGGYVKLSDKTIDVCPRFITANDYENASKYYNKDIISTKYAAPCHFAVRFEEDKSYVKYGFVRKGDALRLDSAYDNPTKAIELFEVRGEDKCSWGTYDTIKQAFADIDRMGNKAADYLLVIDYFDYENVAPNARFNITTPKNAKSVTLQAYMSQPDNEQLLLNNSIVLNCDLVLSGVGISDYCDKKGNPVPINIKLNSYKLSLRNVDVTQRRIGSIEGSGVNGKSALEVIDSGYREDDAYTFTVAKNVDKVGTLTIDKSTVSSYTINSNTVCALGKINVGNIQIDSPEKVTLLGTANVTTKKVKGVKQLTKVDSNITVANSITKPWVESHFYVGLMYKNKNDYVLLGSKNFEQTFDEYNPEILSYKKLGYQIIKGTRLRCDNIEYGDDYASRYTETPCVYAKGSGLYMIADESMLRNYQLGTISNVDNFDSYTLIESYATYKEAIDIINSRNDKSATYVISPVSEDITAEKFVMPKANTARAIYLAASNDCDTFNFAKTNPTLTCDLYMDGVIVNGMVGTTINLGTNKLSIMNDARFDGGVKAIKADGCTKKNKLGELNGLSLANVTDFTVDSVAGVGFIKLKNSTMSVYGTTSIGILGTEGTDNYFNGSCTIKTSKNKVTNITSNTTINNGVVNESEESFVNYGVVTTYKNQRGELFSLMDENELEYSDILTTKSPKVCLLKSKKEIGDSLNFPVDNSWLLCKKANGVYSYYCNYYDPYAEY